MNGLMIQYNEIGKVTVGSDKNENPQKEKTKYNKNINASDDAVHILS